VPLRGSKKLKSKKSKVRRTETMHDPPRDIVERTFEFALAIIALAGQSRPDFISKYSIALKEARETHYWLRLLLKSAHCEQESGSELCQEADELKRILGAIVATAKRNSASR
jgi:hypothetical protein